MAYQTITTLQDPWYKQQPGESPTTYARFAAYCDQIDPTDPTNERTERNVREIADRFNVADRTIREQAQHHRWSERAAAWDEHRRTERRQAHDRRIEAAAEKLATGQLSAANEMTHLVRLSTRRQIESGVTLEPSEISKVADAVVKLGQAATKAPDSARAIYRAAEATNNGTGGSVNMVEVDLPEFKGLSPDAQRERLVDMVSSMSRLNAYTTREQDQTE